MSVNTDLKVYSNSLADNSRNLRREANKFRKKYYKSKDRNLNTQYDYLDTFQELTNQRMNGNKKWSRAVYLARAYLRNTPYILVEQKRNNDDYFYSRVIIDVVNIINTFDPDNYVEYDDVKKWVETKETKSFWSNFKFW